MFSPEKFLPIFSTVFAILARQNFFLLGPTSTRKFLNNFPCLLLGQDTNPSTSAKNIGVLFDSSLNFRKHISQTCRACFYHIRDLCRIRKKSRAFSMSGPALWNALPVPIRNAKTILTFRKLLKSHLFDLAFPPQSLSSPAPC